MLKISIVLGVIMPHGAQKSVRLWYKVEWLPGYLIYRHRKNVTSTQKALSSLLLKINQNRTETEKLDFPIIETTRFTILKEEHATKLLELQPNFKEFTKASDELAEKTQAKLAHELHLKRATPNKKINEALKEIRDSSSYQQTYQRLLQQYNIESLSPKKKKPVPAIKTRSFVKPFRYFGNSINYMENIIKILEVSEGFSQAKIIRDITCGSCTLTFHLASKYPNKKFIASDINGEIINALNYIKQTPTTEIIDSYMVYHNMVFDQPSGEQEKKYAELIKKFNTDSPKDYCLLIFLQNNSYMNVVFHKDGNVSSTFKRIHSAKAAYWVENLKKCKEILAKCDIEFQQMDMHEATARAQPGEFFFMTPPHENDQEGLYIGFIKKGELVNSLNQMSQNNIPYLITYGNNTTRVASDLSKETPTHRFSYIIQGGMEKKPKKLSIYISSSVVKDARALQSLQEYFANLAEKAKKTALKNLVELNKQQKNEDIQDSIILETMAQRLAQEILDHRSLTASSPTPSPISGTFLTSFSTMDQIPEFGEEHMLETISNSQSSALNENLFFEQEMSIVRPRKKRLIEAKTQVTEESQPLAQTGSLPSENELPVSSSNGHLGKRSRTDLIDLTLLNFKTIWSHAFFKMEKKAKLLETEIEPRKKRKIEKAIDTLQSGLAMVESGLAMLDSDVESETDAKNIDSQMNF